MITGAFTGTGALLRIAARRDRWALPLWVAALVATVAGTAATFADLYPDAASRAAFAAGTGGNALFRAFYGPLDPAPDNGALTAWRLGTLGTAVVGLMCLFAVTRHTRTEEETGRRELVGAAPVGRFAPDAAALLLVTAAALAAGLLSAAVLVASGADVTGSVLFGLGLAGGGLVFGAVAAVTAQLCETARAANGLALAALGVAFLLRAAGDSVTGLGALTWMSPLGWPGRLQPFAGDRAVVLVLPPAVTGALVVVAGLLHLRRDLGAGLLHTRSGPPRAGAGLAGPGALAWRRQRGALLGWAVGFTALGAVCGGLADSIGDLTASTPQIADVLRRLGGTDAIVDAYLTGVLGVVALCAAGVAVSMMLRLRSDETARLVEPVLATGVSRLRLLGVQLLWVFGGPALLMLLAGAATGLVAAAVLPAGGPDLGTALADAAARIPAVWVLGGAAVLLVGTLPRWSAAAWAVLAGCVLLAEVGPVVGLPPAVLDLSPFTAVPVSGPVLTPVLVLTAVATTLTAVGAAGFRRRDIA